MIRSILRGQEHEKGEYQLKSGNQRGENVTAEIWKITTTSELTKKWVSDWPFGSHYEYSSKDQWKYYDDTYTVPEGQYATRFFFAAGETQTGNVTVGNLIDDVWFSTELPPAQPNKGHLTVTKEITGVAPNTSLSGYSVTVTVGGDSKTISSFTYNPQLECYVGTASFPNLTPGSYRVIETVSGTIEGYEEDYVSSTTSRDVAVVANQTATATLTNVYTRSTGSLVVTKKVTNVVQGTDLSGYSVTVTVGEETEIIENFEYDVTENAYIGTATFSPLATGRYTVKEAVNGSIPDYKDVATGSITSASVEVLKNQQATATLINKYELDVKDYEFIKEWEGTPTSFVVTLKDGSGKGYPDLTVNVPATGNGTASGNGVSYTAEVDGSDKTWTVTVKDVPGDSDYYVHEETYVDGKTVNSGTATVDANNWWTVSISGSTITNTHHKKVENQGTGTLYIYKTGADDRALEDVTFSLKGNGYDRTATTGADGVAKFENIPVSASPYTLKEESAPADYNLIGTPWTVVVEKVDGTENVTPDTDGGKLHTYNHTAEVTVDGNKITEADKLSITNSKVQAKIQIQKSVDPAAARATEYTFTVKNGETTVDTLKLNDSNSWTDQTDNLPYGTYTITETDPGNNGDYKWDGVSYTGTGVTDNKNNTATVAIGRDDNGQTITVNAANSYSKLTDGQLKIAKSAPNAPDGTKFQFKVQLGSSTEKKGPFTGDTAYNGDGVYTFNLGDDEAATITGILRGTAYTVSETGVVKADGSADAQALSDQYTTNNSGNTSGTISNNTLVTVTYTNTYVTQDFTFDKKDFDDKTTGLPGAVFELRSGDTVITTEPSATNGTVTFTNVPVGTYDLWETQAPTGYEPTNEDTGIDVVVTKTTVTFKEPGGVATFISGLLKTGEKMYDLTGGNLVIYNKHLKGTITIEKTAQANGVNIGGTYTFGIYTKSGDMYTLKNEVEVTISENTGRGSAVSEALNTGVTYYVKETSDAPNITKGDYDLTTTYSGTKNVDGYVPVELDKSVSFTCTNNYTRQTGNLTIRKAVTYGTDVPPANQLADTTEYSFVLEGPAEVSGTYGGVTFTNGTSESFTLIACKDKVFTGLPTGAYTLKEVDPATGKMILSVSAKVTGKDDALTMDDEDAPGTYVLGAQELTKNANMTIAVTNHYELGSDHNRAVFQVKKIDDTSKTVISGAEFTLYSDDPRTNQNPTIVKSVTTVTNGLALFTLEQKVLGAYTDGTAIFYLKETKAPTGYEENDTVWTVTVTKSEDSYSVELAEGQDGNVLRKIWNWVVNTVTGNWSTVENKPTLTVPNTRDEAEDVVEPAYVYLLKVDGADETALSGAVFTLTNVDDPSETIVSVDSTVAGETGVDVVTFDNATTGMTEDDEKIYKIEETTPPTGYQAAKGPLGYVKVTRTSKTELPEGGTKFVTTITYTANVYADEECTTPATLNGSNQLVVENDKLLNVTATKAWQNAEGKSIDAPADASVEFTLFYKVEGSGNAYAEATTAITAEPTITLNATNGWTATWTGLSPDYDYQVKETQGYTDYTAAVDTVNSGDTITNKRDSNSLTITKTVTKDPATLPVDIPDDTTFTVYDETDTEYTSFTYADMTLVSGVKTMVLNNVPTGTYYVVETDADVPYYQLTVTGAGEENAATVDNDADDAVINITNKYEREPNWDEMTELTIKKAVDGLHDNTLSNGKEYYFKVTGTDVYGQKVKQYVTVNLPTDASGKTIDLPISNSAGYTVTEVTVASDSGVAVDEDNTPNAITNYDWTKVEFETVMDGVTTATNVVTLDEEDATATVTATNTYTRKTTPDNAGLTITKNVTGDEGVIIPDDYPFTFTVLADDQPYTGAYTVDGETKNAGTGGTITLMKGETATIGSIPYGTKFTITETEDDGYTLTDVIGGTVDLAKGETTVTIDETTTTAAVAFTNHYVTKGFTIVKEDAENHLYLPGAVFTVYEYADGEKGDVVLTTEPTALNPETFAQETSVSNLPVGTYWMEETTAPENYVLSNEAWIITVTKDDITVEKAEPSIGEQAIQFFTGSDLLVDGKLTVDNTPAVYELTITKTVTGIAEDDQADFTHIYYFNVFRGDNFEEKLTTKPIAVTVAYDKVSDTITGSTTITSTSKDYSWLKADEYLVLEDTATADTETYELTADSVTSKTVTLTQNQSKATIEATAELTNDYDRMLGGLSITKALDGETENEKLRDEVDDKEYTFVITAPSNEVMDYGNGTYATSTTDGTTTTTGTTTFTYDEEADVCTATVTAKIGETVTVSNLPTGTYTVAEDEKSADVEYWNLKVTMKVDQREATDGNSTSATVSNGFTTPITVTNTYTREVPPVEPPEDLLTTLTITKVVQDSRGGDLSALAAGKNYYFQITGEDVYDDAPLTQKVTITGATSTDVKLIWGEYEVTEVDASGNPINAGSAAEIDGYQWNKVEYTDNVDINLDKSTTAATATATNIYEPVPMDIPVVKTWSGDYSSLPNYIEVALYANGNDTGLRLTLDSGDRMDATHWLGVFKSTADHPLYRYENGGKEIVYSVVETSINGYAVNDNTLGYWTVSTGRTTAAAAGLTGYDDDATVLTVRNDYDLPDDDDDDDDDPTPSPSTEPTPSPSPSDEVEIPDDDTPLSDLPDEVPEDEVDIPDEDTPLSDQPDETDIFEEGVPMGDLPQTGSVGDYTAVDPAHTLGMLALAASLMAAGLLVLIGRRKDEETDED
ncbi:DUF5979 domain-containing protein [Intestinimonas sp. CLA-AA-H199]|nr:DUF5979 domain-containing protein [Intestinimonas aquisgranensis]